MTDKLTKDELCQNWIHSHEEDTETEMVFRPAGYRLPRSRGRRSFELRPDGSLIQFGIGPTDKPVETRGMWKLEEDKIALYSKSKSKPSKVMQISHFDKDRLVIKK